MIPEKKKEEEKYYVDKKISKRRNRDRNWKTLKNCINIVQIPKENNVQKNAL